MLITLGSPLALERLRKHLARRRQRFPYEVVGPWINLCGTGDPVTGFRGLSPVFAEALDVFIDTGSGLEPRAAHAATTYLDRPAAARALEWLDRKHEGQGDGPGVENPPEVLLDEGLVSVIAGAQYALRLEQEMQPGDQRSRFSQARAFVLAELAATLGAAGHSHPILRRLAYDNAEYLENRLSPGLAVNTLLTAWAMNTVAPFEMRLDEDVRVNRLTRLAGDLGFPKGVGRDDLRVRPRGARRPPRGTDVAPRCAGRRRGRRAPGRSGARARRRSPRDSPAERRSSPVWPPSAPEGCWAEWQSWALSAAPEGRRPRRP